MAENNIIEKEEKKELLIEKEKQQNDTNEILAEKNNKEVIKENPQVREIIKKEEKECKTKKERKKKNKKSILIITILALILIVLILIITIFSIYNINNSNIIYGIEIEDIDISNKSVEDAKKQIEVYINKKLNEDITLFCDEYEITIKPEHAGIVYYLDETIQEAYAIGRQSNFLVNDFEIIKTIINGKNINLKLEIDNAIFEKFLLEINQNLKGSVEQPNYYIENNELIINAGKEGNIVDKEKLKERIYNKVKNQSNENSKIEIPTMKSEPENIDIDKIYSEIHKEPQDAYVTKEPFEIHSHVEGIDFNITVEEAKKMLEEPKEQYKIPLKIIKPNITNDSLGDEAFPDRLSTYSTKFSTANVNRSTNIRISVNKINGVVLMPGEEFSYNNTIGPTTPQAGYKPGAAYIGGKVVTDYGGGVCQTSSTLYNAALLSNLEITSRTSHYFASDYVPIGRDATVYSPSLDFKFKNNRDYPIKIKAFVDGGTLQVDIFGVKQESDCEVEIESYVTGYIPAKVEYENDSSLSEGTEVVKEYGSSGSRSETYKILKKDGNIISRTLVSRDVYSGHSKVIRRGTQKIVQENGE